MTCQLVFIPDCGDGKIDAGEECDDGNTRDGDGCTSLCKYETTYCKDGECGITAYCGDGIRQSALGEQCDDGNRVSNDDCDNSCKWTRLPECGDGIVQPDYEQCDQGQYNGDYNGTPCHANCVLPYCGDGFTDANEECDDGNNLNGDSCSAVCTFENRAAPTNVFQGGLLQGQLGQNPTGPATLPTLPYNTNNPQSPLNPYQQQYYGNIPTPARTPTGPGLVIFLASGAAAGVGVARRRFLKRD